MELANRLRRALGNRYLIEEEIGRGGMAVVFRARDLKHDRAVALKVLRADLAASVGPDRFLREIRIISGLQHPHILPLLDSGDADGALFYAMPYVEGETLRSKLDREHELPVSDAVRMLLEVADALAYAHKSGIVHRDIKPDNVLLSGRHALVADFGISKAVNQSRLEGSQTLVGTSLGTPAYMAPEQAAIEASIDHRADIYALGVLGYELLTGRPPFSGTAQQLMTAQVAEAPRPIREIRGSVPDSVAAVIERCLEKRPADRWQTAAEVRDALESAEGRGTRSTARSAGAERRTKQGSWLFAAAGATIVAAFGVWLVAGQDWSRHAQGWAEASAVPTLAILPFDNFTGDPEQDHLVDGITDVLTSSVAKIRDLRVTSRSSVMGYKHDRPSIPRIASDLGVQFLLEGSVMRVGDRMTLTAQLIRGETDEHLWAETYEGDLSSILGLLANVSREIAGQVEVVLTPEDEGTLAGASAASPQVVDAVLRARGVLLGGTPQEVTQAIRTLESALDLDPSFALAWGVLALAHATRASWFGGHEEVSVVRPAVQQAARRALALDPDQPDARRALLDPMFDVGWDELEEGLRGIIDREPSNADIRVQLTNILTAMGRFDEAEELARSTTEIAPLWPVAHTELMNVLANRGRFEEALVPLKRSLELDPSHSETRLLLPGVLAVAERCDRPGPPLDEIPGIGGAAEEAERLLESCGNLPLCLNISAFALIRCGQAERGKELLARLEARARTEYVSPVLRSRLHLLLGDRDRALELLQEGLESQDPTMQWIANGLYHQSLRGDPRFEAIVDSLGLPRGKDYWTAAVALPSRAR